MNILTITLLGIKYLYNDYKHFIGLKVSRSFPEYLSDIEPIENSGK